MLTLLEKNKETFDISSVSKDDLKKYSDILNGDPIQELILWNDDAKEFIIRGIFKRFSDGIKGLSKTWSEVMKDPLKVENLVGLPDCEFYLKETYIDQEGFRDKLPFVKKEKLSEIVDFPDFSKLISNISSLNELIETSKSYGFGLKSLISHSTNGFSEELNSKIEFTCEVKIKGWKEIQKFTSILVYLNSLVELHRHVNHTWRDLNGYFVRKNILQENGGLLSFNLLNLQEKLPGIH